MRASISRTATFAFSPSTLSSSSSPLIATGTVSGALDESFSNDSLLEIWEAFPQPTKDDSGLGIVNTDPTVRATVKTTARFNRLAWGYVDSKTRPKGVIAAGMENGELDLWDAAKMLAGEDATASLIKKNTQHTGPVKGLAFNDLQPNLLGSGAVNGEIFIWDLTNPEKPYSPGQRSRHLSDITAFAWNRHVPHVLATASNSGYTVVWDLKARKEVVALSYAGGPSGATGMHPGIGGMGMQGNQWMGGAGGRTGLSAVAWHPDNTTKLVTASEDDSNPIIMVWDLRNSRAPEKILTGHEKGILSLAWCNQDSDLLLSCGKDCRTLAWNPNTGEIVGEAPGSANWAHEVQWCPRNPDLLATASFDGEIGVHSLQSTGDPSQQLSSTSAAAAASANGADIFNSGLIQNAARAPMTLKQTPKWLKRPVSATFGFAGKLVSVANKPAAAGDGAEKQATREVTVHNVVTEPVLIERAVRLREALDSGDLAAFCEEKERDTGVTDQNPDEATSWKLLRLLFNADSRDELVTLLGFSTDDVRAKVEDAIKHFKSKSSASRAGGVSTAAGSEVGDDSASVAREPLVTFAEAPADSGASASSDKGDGNLEATPSEPASALSDSTKQPDTESELTEPSLFGDDNATAVAGGANAAPQAAADDFYAQIRAGRPAALPQHILGLTADGLASSAAATQGSRASSVISGGVESVRATTFKIYPSEESDAERLITRALVLGDFESAVSLCLSSERFADALLLATRGGPELLARTQKAYFEKRTAALPYLRLFQSIVTDDLTDVVQNADLAEWQEIFVVLCTFAKKDEFANLTEQLGDRLNYQYSVVKNGGGAAAAKTFRKNAVLCYLAAGKLERVVGIWAEEMKEEEARAVGNAEGEASTEPVSTSRQTAHAKALQTFIEKVTVFQSAANYVDVDLAQPTRELDVAASGARTYKLAPVYDAYYEYAELLASQGLVNVAVTFVGMTPADYKGAADDVDHLVTRQRLENAAGKKAKPIPDQRTPLANNVGLAPARPPVQQPVQPPSSYGGYNAPAPANNGYANAYGTAADPYAAPQQPAAANTGYNSYGAGSYGGPQQAPSYGQPPSTFAPAYGGPPPSNYQPPNAGGAYTAQNSVPRPGSAQPPPPPPPAAARKDVGAWNDAPQLPKRAPSAAGPQKTAAAAIHSPFGGPGAPPPPAFQAGYGAPPGQQAPPPPPSRNANRTPAQPVPPPPRPGQQQQPGPPQSFGGPQQTPNQQGHYQPGRPMSVGPGQQRLGPGQQQGSFGPPQQQGQQAQQAPAAYDPYAPPPQPAGAQQGPPPQQSPPGQPGFGPGSRGPPGPPGPPGGQFRPPGPPGAQASSPAPPPPQAPAVPAKPTPKYPPGNRDHIPDSDRPIVEMLSQQMSLFKQAQPAYPKKMVDDTERRINALFDHLNCETLSRDTVAQVFEIVKAIRGRDYNRARSLHLQLLTGGPAGDDLSSWMPGLKALIPR